MAHEHEIESFPAEHPLPPYLDKKSEQGWELIQAQQGHMPSLIQGMPPRPVWILFFRRDKSAGPCTCTPELKDGPIKLANG